MCYLIRLTLLIALFSSSAFAGEIFKPAHFTLENGLCVYILKRTRAPVVISRLYYQTGSMDEKTGKTGLAHYLEHLLFNDKSNELQYNDIKEIPTHHNAHTTEEYTCFEHDVPSSYLKSILKYDAGLMQSLALETSDFEKEKAVVLNELQESLSDTEIINMERINRVFFCRFFPRSSYYWRS